ncbi:MAG: hypothetical protein R8K50_03710 [Mariprofundus sp.]
MNTIVYLRRMIINQKPARLDYTTNSSTKSIYYERLGFAGTPDEISRTLREVFAADKIKVISDADLTPASSNRIFAPKAISYALSGYTFDAASRARLLGFTMRLPPLSVRLFPLQRYAFQDTSAYLEMHQQYQRNGFIRMQQYLAQAENRHNEVVRLRVMMATYILGLITPLTASAKDNLKTQRIQQLRQKKTSILRRIIDKVRGL